MKIDKTMLILGGLGLAAGAYFLWPKIKDNFSFATTQASLPERAFPGRNVFPVEGKSFPGQGNAYGQERGIGYAYGHDITQGRGPHLA